MPDIYLGSRTGTGLNGWLHVSGDYKPGDPDPSPCTYMDWQEWAEVQHKAGLRQTRCGRCSKCTFPQDMSALIDVTKPFDRYGRHHTVKSPVCKKCEAKNPVAHVGKKTPLPKRKK